MEDGYISGEEHRAAMAKRPKAPRKQLSQSAMIGIAIGLVVVGSLGTLLVTHLTQKNKPATPSTGLSPNSSFGSGGPSGGPMLCSMGSSNCSQSGPVSGKVTAVSATSITIQLSSGSSQTFSITSSTKEGAPNQGPTAFNVNDVKVGDTVGIVASSSDSNQADVIIPSFDANGPQTQQSSSY